jgi:hypothetical protein
MNNWVDLPMLDFKYQALSFQIEIKKFLPKHCILITESSDWPEIQMTDIFWGTEWCLSLERLKFE